MDMEWPTKINNPYGFFMDFLWIFNLNLYGLWIFYGFRILKNMDYGMDMDLVLNPSGPTAYNTIKTLIHSTVCFWM